MSFSWVNAELAQVEKSTARVNGQWEPTLEETLSGDEIYSNGSPNLLLAGNDSLYISALLRQPACEGETGDCVLLEAPAGLQFASAGGSGLAAGARTAEIKNQQ
ncbi:MAG: hypothetical protein K8R89_05660 [Anaerolineae bacterium]|nr:hypothetical protein [Anaerolineae bacterium]